MKLGIDFDSTIIQTDIIRQQWIYQNLGISVLREKTGRTYSVPLIGLENHERMIHETGGEKTFT